MSQRARRHCCPTCKSLLRAGEWSVTVAVHRDAEILAIWPGFKESIYGVAIDVGSTTIAAHLCDLGSGDVLCSNGMMNPQIRFGEDLMSRVSYVMMHPEGRDELTREVRGRSTNSWPEPRRTAASRRRTSSA